MKIELRNVQYAAFASEETECFTATIYVDGKREGEARNDGKGGMTFITPRALEQRLDEYGKTLPPLELGEGYGSVPHRGETIVDGLLHEWLVARDLKRAMSTRILFTRTDKSGVFETKTIKGLASELAKGEEYIRSKMKSMGPAKILNLLPFEEALAIYKDEPMAEGAQR